MEFNVTKPSKELCERFGLRHGWFSGYIWRKNCHVFLDNIYVCYTDLTEDDLKRIAALLFPGEVVTIFNEHHGTDWQSRISDCYGHITTNGYEPDYNT